MMSRRSRRSVGLTTSRLFNKLLRIKKRPPKLEKKRPKATNGRVAYRTDLGVCFCGLAEDVLGGDLAKGYLGTADLVFTSPPFPLNRKKKYDNLQGTAYVDWISSFSILLKKLLKPTGSIVIEVGNSWEPGKPVMSTLALEALLAFLKVGKLNLCQQFVWHNPARLPSPAQWVTVERIRLKDSYTHLWWMSPTERPKANNRNVPVKYSDAMERLLKTKTYNSGPRPSEHHIGKKSFLKRHRGAISPSLITLSGDEAERQSFQSNVITMANTQSSTDYQRYCREHAIEPHPARMPIGLADFFIRFLTDEGDLVIDPFAGSNTTGAAAELLKRRWVSVEPNPVYIEGSQGRFERHEGR